MRRMHSGFSLVLFLMMLGFGVPPRLAAQDTPHSVGYLQQVAAAVEGYSGGGIVFIVMCGRRDPYQVRGAFPTKPLAQAAAAAVAPADGPCYVEGPYFSNVSFAGGVVTYGKGCNKQIDSSCPLADTSRAAAAAPVPITDVQSVTVMIRLKNGQTITDSFPPTNGEAIFLSMSAVDKLLIPYLVRVYGVEYAATQRRLFLRRFGGAPKEY